MIKPCGQSSSQLHCPALLANYPEGKDTAGMGERLLYRRGGLLTGHDEYWMHWMTLSQKGASSYKYLLPTLMRMLSILHVRGYYPAHIEDAISAQQLTRYFMKEGSGYRITAADT